MSHAYSAQHGRRRFLKTALASGGAVVAAAVVAPASQAVSAAPAKVKPAQGYQKTAHVRRYYDSAR